MLFFIFQNVWRKTLTLKTFIPHNIIYFSKFLLAKALSLQDDYLVQIVLSTIVTNLNYSASIFSYLWALALNKWQEIVYIILLLSTFSIEYVSWVLNNKNLMLNLLDPTQLFWKIQYLFSNNKTLFFIEI